VVAAIEGEGTGSDDEVEMPPKHYLTQFQVEKLSKYFSCWFDLDNDGLVTESDFGLLNQKIIKFAEWDDQDRYVYILKELHQNFWSCLLEATDKNYHLKAKKTVSVTLDDWLNMWGRLTRGAMAMSNFPYWVQLLPKIMFAIIDKDGDGEISKAELKDFYQNFMKVDAKLLENLTDRAYKNMTSNSDFPLTCDLYEMVFANFLLGRTFAGPGQFIFGIFETSSQEQEVHIIAAQEDQQQDNAAWGRRKSHFMMHIAKRKPMPSAFDPDTLQEQEAEHDTPDKT
jgi:Ca2+-binding EF-hand superfamily protein